MKMEILRKAVYSVITIMFAALFLAPYGYAQDDDSSRNILKQGLLGAGTGAIAASASGGNAGKGALIGAGTGVIGSALLDALTGPSQSSSRRSSRRSSAPPPTSQDDDYYYVEEPADEYYDEPPQESGTQQVLKQGLIGAGTGAIAAGASGGNAGQGALIGAGTSVIGNALLDTLTQPPAQRRGRTYRRIPKQQAPPQHQQRVVVQQQQQDDTSTDVGTHKKIIRKYDENGKVVSEEEIYY